MDSKTPYIIGGLAVLGVGAYFLLRKTPVTAAATPGTTALPAGGTPVAGTPATTVPQAMPAGWPTSIPWPPPGLPAGTALPTAKPAWWPAGITYPPTVPTNVSNVPSSLPGTTTSPQPPAEAKFNRLGATPDQEAQAKQNMWHVLQMVALADATANPATLDATHTVGLGSSDPSGTSAAQSIAMLNDALNGGGQYVLISVPPTDGSGNAMPPTFLFTNLEGAMSSGLGAGVGGPWTLFLTPNEWRTVEAAVVAQGAPPAVPTLPQSAPTGWPAGVAWPPTGWTPGQPVPSTAPSGWPASIPWPPTSASIPGFTPPAGTPQIPPSIPTDPTQYAAYIAQLKAMGLPVPPGA